jgi:phosphate/sulfate permease
MGVGIINALLRGRAGTSGVGWSQATNIGKASLLSPLFAFALAALLLFVFKTVMFATPPFAVCRTNRRPVAAVVGPRHSDPYPHFC